MPVDRTAKTNLPSKRRSRSRTACQAVLVSIMCVKIGQGGRRGYPIVVVKSGAVRRTLFLLALTIRLAAIFATGPGTIRFGDGIDYIDTAKALCATGSYPAKGSLPFFRAPGLPFFIAAVTACHPSAVVAIKIGLAGC